MLRGSRGQRPGERLGFLCGNAAFQHFDQGSSSQLRGKTLKHGYEPVRE